MKVKSKNLLRRKLMLFVAALFFIISCNRLDSTTAVRIETPEERGNISVNFETSSVYFTQEELIAKADLIFAGTVLDISPTRWNQDSGEYWAETTEEGVTAEGERLTTTHAAWPVYEITLVINQPIVNELGVSPEVVLTLLGKSPVSTVIGDAENNNIQLDAETVNLQIGQEIIVFAMQTEIAWRDPSRSIELITDSNGTTYFDIGKHSIITLMGVYDNAYLVKGSDGLFYPSESASNRQEPIPLEKLILTISERRDISGN